MSNGPALTTTAVTAAIHTLDSAVLGETRRYWVYLPPGYSRDSDSHYPVVVQLDGHTHGSWSPSTMEYMIRRKRVPPLILVGVHNKNGEDRQPEGSRARDLTPTHSLVHYDGTLNDGYRLSGGADRFLAFLEEELLPGIDRDYRTLPQRAIVGQSLSGCFVLNAYLTGLSRFQSFLAMDPCLWWDGDRAKRLTTELETGGDLFTRGLFVAFSGTDEPGRKMQQAWFDQLAGKAGAPNRHHLCFAHYADESHRSMNLKGFYEGLTFLFGASSRQARVGSFLDTGFRGIPYVRA